MRLPIVGVMGSGTKEHRNLSEPVGRLVAGRGAHLLTGGGAGVMTAVARAFCAVENRKGLVIGILPAEDQDHPERPRPGYPNEFVEIAIRTHLPFSAAKGADPLSRNHINVLTADALVFLPGGAGTESEAVLAKRYGRSAFAVTGPADLNALADFLARTLGGISA